MNEVDLMLAHAGVKGMKWGVRRDRRVQRLANAGIEGSSKASRARASSELSVLDLKKGVEGGARERAIRQKDRNERVRTGKGSTKDLLAYYGGTKLEDFIPVKTNNVNKKDNPKREQYLILAAGTAFVTKALYQISNSDA